MRLSALAMSCLVYTCAVQAHHSFSMFDATQEKSLKGAVKDFQWTNPHSWIWLDVASSDGTSIETWGIEGMSPNYLGRRGWSKRTLKPGDIVMVVIHPLKDESKGGTFMRVTMSDGTVMDMMGGAGGDAINGPAHIPPG